MLFRLKVVVGAAMLALCTTLVTVLAPGAPALAAPVQPPSVALPAKSAAGPKAPTALQHRARTQVYIVPHQDDETLTMGAAIAADARAGRTVIVVLVIRGENSGALTKINRDLAARRLPTIDMKALVASRDRELEAALRALGVPARNVWRMGLSDHRANAPISPAVDRIVRRYGPAAGYNSMSWLDKHPTHYHLGSRMDALCRAGRVKECHFYQYLAYQPAAKVPGLVDPIGTPNGAWITNTDGRVRRAAQEYRVWNPARGRYAVGWTYSVSKQFAELWRTPRSWTHLDGSRGNWHSPTVEKRALGWQRTHHGT